MVVMIGILLLLAIQYSQVQSFCTPVAITHLTLSRRTTNQPTLCLRVLGESVERETSSVSYHDRKTSLDVAGSKSNNMAESKVSQNDDDDDDNHNNHNPATSPEASATSKSSSASKPPTVISDNPVSKFRRLKDFMWIRETLEDLTAAEFACSVEASAGADGRKRKRAVDYEKLLSQLNRRIRDMVGPDADIMMVHGSDPEITEGKGMGRFVYTHDQRIVLLK